MSENEAVKQLTHNQLKINDLKEDIAKAEKKVSELKEKLAGLEQIEANAAQYDTIKVGSTVQFNFGRGDKKRLLTGTVTAEGHDEKLGRMLAVSHGEGLDVSIVKIRVLDVVFGNDGSTVDPADPLSGVN